MKQVILLLSALVLLAFAMPARAQIPSNVLTLNKEEHYYYYEKVFPAEGKPKAFMYKAFKDWIVKNIKGGSVASYYDDAENNTISTNPTIVVRNGASVDFKLNIELKEGKYRVRMNSFVFHNGYGLDLPFGEYTGLMAPRSYKERNLRQVEDAVVKILAALEHSLTETAGSDW